MQSNTIEKQGLLMRGYWRICWKTLKQFRYIEITKQYYGRTMFINVGMLAEMLESIEHI